MTKKRKGIKIVITAFVAVLAVSSIFLVMHPEAEKLKAFCAYFSYPESFNEAHQPLSRFHYDRLNDRQKQAYICIFEQIEKHPAYIKVPELSQKEFSEVYFAVKNDNPDMLCFADSCNMITFSSVCMLQLHYDYTESDCAKKSAALAAQADKIIAEMPPMNDDWEKELYIHDYIVQHCFYEDTAESSNAYGCLVAEKAVCSGYSRGAMLLLEKAGIRAALISGKGQSKESGRVSHMWNIVWMNGEPYHLDVTWDDPNTDDENNILHLYFNLTDEDIAVDHMDFFFDAGCTAVTDNYFEHEDIRFSAYSLQTIRQIGDKLTDNILKGKNYAEFVFADSVSYNAAIRMITDNGSPNSDMYKIVSRINDRAADLVDTTHVSFSTDETKKYIKIMFDFI